MGIGIGKEQQICVSVWISTQKLYTHDNRTRDQEFTLQHARNVGLRGWIRGYVYSTAKKDRCLMEKGNGFLVALILQIRIGDMVMGYGIWLWIWQWNVGHECGIWLWDMDYAIQEGGILQRYGPYI